MRFLSRSPKALSLALLLGLSSLISLLSPFIPDANASDYNILQTDTLHIGGTSGECVAYGGSMETSWPELANQSDSVPYSYKNTWNYTSNYDNGRNNLQEWADEYATRLSEGAGWAVFQVDLIQNGLENADGVGIAVFDGDLDVTISDGLISFPSGTKYRTFGYNPNVGCRYQALTYSGTISSLSVGPGQGNEVFMIASDHIQYPEDYTGEPINTGFTPDEIVRPDFTYAVDNKHVVAKDYNTTLPTITPDEGYTINGYSVEWSLFKCGEWDAEDKSCSDSTLVDHKIQAQTEQYQYDVADYGEYNLQAEYLVQECYRYPSYPATPDNCFYVDLETELEDYEFLSTTVHLTIDGSQISGDTKEGDCDGSGFCEPPSLYEDCTTYGLDLGGYIACIISNFQKWLNITLRALFIPSGAYFENYWNDLSSFLNTKLGFIWQAIAAVVSLLSDMISNAASPNCSTGSLGTFYGTSVAFDMCEFEELSPTIWTLITTLVRSITVMAMVFAFYRKYHEVVDHR